jgi:DNA-directed RNA polymerase sigma subunit (sigma70/sigma32)|tara:strand:+ start:194 stop:535 length:342 start_codon:yes stop_codon:yes gene_type:complete
MVLKNNTDGSVTSLRQHNMFPKLIDVSLNWEQRLRNDLEIPDTYKKIRLWEAINSLSEKRRDIVMSRFGIGEKKETIEPKSMNIMAAEWSVTRQFIFQTMMQARVDILKKLLQ